MIRDPIVDEVRAIRDAFARKNDYDVKRIVDALQKQALPDAARVVSLPAKRVRGEPPERESARGSRTGRGA